MSTFFNNVINTLIRNLPFVVRTIIALLFLLTAIWCFMKSVNVKGENFSAINWGWFSIFALFFIISFCYVTL